MVFALFFSGINKGHTIRFLAHFLIMRTKALLYSLCPHMYVCIYVCMYVCMSVLRSTYLHLAGPVGTRFRSYCKLKLGWPRGITLPNFRPRPLPVWPPGGRKAKTLAPAGGVNCNSLSLILHILVETAKGYQKAEY